MCDRLVSHPRPNPHIYTRIHKGSWSSAIRQYGCYTQPSCTLLHPDEILYSSAVYTAQVVCVFASYILYYT